MKKFFKVFSTYIMTPLSALITAEELAHGMGWCWGLGIISLLAIATASVCLLRRKGDSSVMLPVLVSGLILLFFTGRGIIGHGIEKKRTALWQDFIERNAESTLSEMETAAEGTDTYAMLELSDALSEGKIVSPDFEKAKEYAQKAADLGNPLGYHKLGLIYLNGYGVKVDSVRALASFVQAASFGSEVSGQYIDSLSVKNELPSSLYSQMLDYRIVEDYISDVTAECGSKAAKDYKDMEKNLRKVLRKHHDNLSALSERGYLRATSLLYTEASVSSDEKAMHELAQILYKGRCIPDDIRDKREFFTALYGSDAYEESMVETYIRDGYFLTLLEPERLKDFLSDDPVALYEFRREQYKWCQEQLAGGNPSRNFILVSSMPESHKRLMASFARQQLEEAYGLVKTLID